MGAVNADDAGLLPDGAFTAELGVPALGIVAAGVGIGHEDVDLTGSETGEGAGVGIGLHGAGEIRDALAVVILQPQGGIDVAGGGEDVPMTLQLALFRSSQVSSSPALTLAASS